jgi:ELWxxDGT repeat protein
MTSPRRVADIHPGSESSYPGSLAAVGNTLFFTVNDGTSGNELWALDLAPTPSTTTTAAITAVTDDVGLIQGTVAANGRTDNRTPTNYRPHQRCARHR